MVHYAQIVVLVHNEYHTAHVRLSAYQTHKHTDPTFYVYHRSLVDMRPQHASQANVLTFNGRRLLAFEWHAEHVIVV